VSDSVLHLEARHEGDTTFIALGGDITEEAELDLALEGIGKNAVIDLSGIKRVNSFGVRNWVNFMQALAEVCESVRFENCATCMVRQFSMVPTTRKGAHIGSLMLPYYCPDCDDEREIRLEVRAASAPEEPPEENCPECGEEMEFDDVPESYFSFWGAPEEKFIDET
jgi:hypothetical protein